MGKLLLVVCMALALAPISAPAQSGGTDSAQTPPAASLIKPRSGKADPHSGERVRPKAGPIDDRCKPLKNELESALQRQDNARRNFQARLAHNAGSRLCRVGQAEKGMAEFRKGLSYLEDRHHP